MNWLLKPELVLVAFRDDHSPEWHFDSLHKYLRPDAAVCAKGYDWIAASIWEDGTIVIQLKPKHRSRWLPVQQFPSRRTTNV